MLKIQKQMTILCHKLNDLSINAIESIVKLYRYDAKRQQGFSRERTIFILKYSSFLQMCGIITLSHVFIWYIGRFQNISIPYHGRLLGFPKGRGGSRLWNSEGMGGGGVFTIGNPKAWVNSTGGICGVESVE